MRKLLPLVILLLCFFCINITNAQSNKSIITTEDVGPLKCFYLKNETANQISEYHIQVVYKNQQFVYKQEQDTIHLKSKEQIAQFVTEIKAGLLVISDEEKEFNIANSNYTLFKNKGYSDNNFIVIANKVSEFGVQVIYKNQQFVYKQEEDTIHLKSKEQIAQFVTDIKAGLLMISDEEKEFNIANSNYTLFKNKGYSDNNFIVIANKVLTIKAPINKFFANQLITWLNSIDFGKG